jgi:hypothetical protein
VLDLAQLRVAVQNATIEFYKQRLEQHQQQHASSGFASPQAALVPQQHHKPPPHQQQPQQRPPQQQQQQQQEDDVELVYERSLDGGGKLRVRGVAGSQGPAPAPVPAPAPAPLPGHFSLHYQRLEMLRSQLRDFETMRNRLTTRISL